MKDFGLSRDVPVKRGATALLFVDVQNYSAEGGGEYVGLAPEAIEARYGYFFREMRQRAVPNMRKLQRACREAGVEVMYTVIESLTLDGRDMGLDYKISGLFCPRGIARRARHRRDRARKATRSCCRRRRLPCSFRRTSITSWAISA